MKKAAYYARVSSDLQKKEKTIDSQVVELKKQIINDGNVLVKEYVDDGYSGARLDRPAMNQLREDLKTNLFDTIYFLNTDRIAREVTYQTIIIAEILKYRKQVIINGKDYIHNPENKFTLTFLGAVAELERAKIIERVTRAKQHRISQGFLLGCGNNIYGYDYHVRTPTSAPFYTINEIEAKIVRYIFETYAKGGIGMNRITQHLEEINAPTKQGRGLWRGSLLKCMLKNEMYTGIRYYNTMSRIREYANPIHGIKHTTSKLVRRDRSEWVGVKVPAVISKELFDKVQERIQHNRSKYRNPRVTQLLSGLVRCGCCGSGMFAYRRYYIDRRMTVPRAYNRLAYKCNQTMLKYMHAQKNRSKLRHCDNIQIKGPTLEDKVFRMIEENILDYTKLKEHMPFFKRRVQVNELRIVKELQLNDKETEKTKIAKRRLVDLYTAGEIERSAYVAKSIQFDNDINRLALVKQELTKKIPLLHKKDVVEVHVRRFSETLKARYQKCVDFDTTRKFLTDYIDSISYYDDKIEVHGSIPIESNSEDNVAKVEFNIKSTIPYSDRLKKSKGPINGSVPISRKEHDKFLLIS